MRPSIEKMVLVKSIVDPIEFHQEITCTCIVNKQLYVGTKTSKVYVCEMALGEGCKFVEKTHFYPHCDYVWMISTNHKSVVITAGDQKDHVLRIWSPKTLKILHAYKGHTRQITKTVFLNKRQSLSALKISHKPEQDDATQYVASASFDGSVFVWRLGDSFCEDNKYHKYTGILPVLEIQELDDEILLIGGDDCYITFWNWWKEEVTFRQYAHVGSVNFLHVAYPKIISVGGDGKIKLWEVKAKKDQIWSIFLPKYSVKVVKQLKKKLGQQIFGFMVNADEILISDQRGAMCLYKDEQIEEISLKMHYTEEILSINYHLEHLLVTSSKGYIILARMERNSKTQELQQQAEMAGRVKRSRPSMASGLT